MPRSARPGICGDETLSTCISSTWFRVMGGRGKNSAIEANARQAANGMGTSIGPNVDFVCDGPEEFLIGIDVRPTAFEC